MKPLYHILVFFLLSSVTALSQSDLSNFSNQEIVNSEMELHHFMEDYDLDLKIIQNKPSYVVSALDESIFEEFFKEKLPSKYSVLKRLLNKSLNESALQALYDGEISNQLANPNLETEYNRYKNDYMGASQDGWRVSSRTAGQACVNIDFETGDWSGWDPNIGNSCTGGVPDCYTNGVPGSNTGDPNNQRQHLIVGAGTDPSVPLLSTLSPFGGASSLRLGNEMAGYGAEKIAHTFLVIPGQEIFTYAFAVVLQDPGTSHTIEYKPFFGIEMFDQNGNPLADTCAHYNVTAGTGKPGFQSYNPGGIEWKDWAQISVDLTAYVGQNVTIEFTTSDCDFGGHWGRAYIDATCAQPIISVVPDCEGIRLQAPAGFFGYEWRNANTGAVLSTTFDCLTYGPGHYEVDLISENGCLITIDTVMNSLYVGLSHTAVTTNLTCYNDASGSIDVNASGGIPPYRYSIDNGATFVTNDVFNGLSAGSYDIIIEDAYGCRDTTFNYVITQPALLGVDLTIADATCNNLCNGGAVAAPYGGTRINGGYLYSWDGNANTTANSLSGLCAGVHTLRVTDSNGCFIDTSFTIIEPAPVPLNNVVLVDEACYNSCLGEIHINEPTAVQFSIDGGSTYQANGNYTNLCAAASPYYLVVQDATGCITRDTVTLNQPPPTAITASNDTLICSGSVATLSANMTGGTTFRTGSLYTYTWYDGTNQVFVGTPFLASPSQTTTYTVIGTDANGCQSLETVEVNVLDPLSVVAFSDATICEGDSIQMHAIASGGNGNYTYSWDNGGGVTQYTTVYPIVTTTYTVTVSDGCSSPDAQASVTITVNPLPVISFVADTNEGCVPAQINFTNNTSTGTVANCLWDFGDGAYSPVCGQVSHTYTDTGVFNVNLTVTSPDGCVASLSNTNMITVHPNPIADFEADKYSTDVFAPEVNFTNTSTGAILYNWTYDVLASSNAFDSTIVFPISYGGEYNICLEAISIYGCTNTICKIVTVKDKSYLFVPNSFTPDGDGKNDDFFPYVVGIDKDDFKFYVFNRWGDLIFETDRYGHAWDGTWRGQMSQQDAFVWKVEARSLETGNMIEEMGHVILLK